MKCANLMSRSVETALGHLRAAVLELENLSELSPEDALYRESFVSKARSLLHLQVDLPKFGDQRILLGVSEGGLRQELLSLLTSWGLRPEVCDDCPALYRQALQSTRLGVVLLDEDLPGFQGDGSLQAIRQAGGAPVIKLSELGPDPWIPRLLKVLEHHLVSAPKPPTRLDGQLGREHPLRVLIAEDLALNQKLIGLLLSRMGYQADTANNGYEVMLKVEQEDYDLILMDLNMPGMNGLEAAARVRQLKPLASGGPRLVAMSANLPGGTPQGSGFEEFLAKPVQFEQLQDVLRNSPCRQTRQDNTPNLPVLDPEIVSNLRRLGDREFLDSLLDDAAQELPQMVGLLMDYWSRGQADEVAQMAHAIKGSASTLGATRVARLAGEIEQFGKTRQLIGQPVALLAEALDEALEQLQN